MVITGLVPAWPAATEWTSDRLRQRFGDRQWRVSATRDMRLDDYLRYCQGVEGGASAAATGAAVAGSSPGGCGPASVAAVAGSILGGGGAAAAAAGAGLERPLYLFDKDFCTKFPEMATEFTIPPYFAEVERGRCCSPRNRLPFHS